jgi:acyl carrier protein
MTPQEVRQVVIDIIADIAPDEELDGLKDEVSLKRAARSRFNDFLDIVMELRKHYKVEVPADDYPQLASLSSCVSYLTPKMVQ